MRQLAVRPDSQGEGIGRTLVRYSESFARDRGYQEIFLHARQTPSFVFLRELRGRIGHNSHHEGHEEARSFTEPDV